MANYRLLLCFAATLSFGVALAAQTTPAIKRAKPVHSTEASPKPAASPNGEKEAAEKTPAPPKEPAITFNSVHVDGPYIAMTFDDGPSATLTPKLLDILAAHHIRVTFFVLGEMVAEHPEILARAAREGRSVRNNPRSIAAHGRDRSICTLPCTPNERGCRLPGTTNSPRDRRSGRRHRKSPAGAALARGASAFASRVT